ncbi:MAG: hypothetical protein MHMPM18_001865 [Marteilia pararefringens]
MSFFDLYQSTDSSSGASKSILPELVVISQHFLFIALIAFIIDYYSVYLIRASTNEIWDRFAGKYRCAFGYLRVNDICEKVTVFLNSGIEFPWEDPDAPDVITSGSNKALIVILVLALLAILIVVSILCFKKRKSLPCFKNSYTFGANNTRDTARGYNSKFNESLYDGATGGNVGNFSSINNAPARDALDSDYVIDHVEQAPGTL